MERKAVKQVAYIAKKGSDAGSGSQTGGNQGGNQGGNPPLGELEG